MSGGQANQVIEAARAEIAAGAPRDALDRLAAACTAIAADPRLYHTGFEALCAVVTAGRWKAADLTSDRAELFKQMLLQKDCAEHPLIFHHGLASLLTSNNTATAQAVTKAVSPLLQTLIGPHPPRRALLIFLLIARSCLDDRPSSAEVSRWHLDAFPTFSRADMELPYSVMFNVHSFGKNRDDLMGKYRAAAASLGRRSELGLRHILLLDWLGVPSPFTDRDNHDLLEALERCLPTLEEKEAEEAAARSLILRYGRQGGVLTPARLESLGLGSAVIEAAVQRSRPQPMVGEPRGTTRVGLRPYQAIQAARLQAARYMPFLARAERGIRVGVCVSGQLRGYRAALASWKRTLLAHVDHDIFVHTWERVGSAGAQPFRKVLPFEGDNFSAAWRLHGMIEGYAAMQARYPTLFAALDKCDRITEANLCDFYGAHTVVMEDETAPRFDNFSNQDKMHYKIHAAHRLAVESDGGYDLVLRIRPDFGVRINAFSWSDIAAVCRNQPVIWADHAFGVHYGNPMIGDQVAVGAPEAMEAYAISWETYLPLARLRLTAAPVCFQGHVSLAQTTWLNGVNIRRIPLKSLGLLDANRLSVSAIREALHCDTDRRHDAVDQALLEAIDRDQG